MIDDVLDLARIEAGELILTASDIDLSSVCEEVVSTLLPPAARQQDELTVVASACAPVRADPTRIRQILINLTSNALRFTRDGTVSLTVRCDGDEATVSVRDTGIGIPEEHLERLFQPFYQVDASSTRRHDGTGLGLAISQDLARAHGGRITVDSVVGEGSTFTLHLPTAR